MIHERESVKATKTNATLTDAPNTELWDVRIVTVNAESKAVATLLLAENGTELKVIAKLDAQGRSWVLLPQVMLALATKNIGVEFSGLKSKRVARLVRLLHVSLRLVHSHRHRKRWEMFVLSR